MKLFDKDSYSINFSQTGGIFMSTDSTFGILEGAFYTVLIFRGHNTVLLDIPGT